MAGYRGPRHYLVMRSALRAAFLTALSILPAILAAQDASLSAADSGLIGRILLAEDRRDSTHSALAQGRRHADARVRFLAQRAFARIRDPRFAARDSFPAGPAPVAWPEPAWRLRDRALATRRDDCNALRSAHADSAWPVRHRATD